MAFEYAYDLSGCSYPVIKEFDIADATGIYKGELVRFTSGYIVTGGTDYTTPYLGVAAEAKTASDGKTRIKVYCSPSAVFKADPIETTVTATPSTTTWTDSTAILNSTNDTANGGKLKIKSLVAGHTGTYVPGKIIPITDYTTSAIVCAAASFPGSTTVGDIALFFPPIGDLGVTPSATNGLTLTWAATDGTALEVVDHDLDNDKVFVTIKLHQFSN
ncbi:MAG: hypothetical protein M0R06_23905 [Sphaerochaeta sp.]|jgi:hypothetical protein|nr:hypothetical protein [Sphaerochaeta sp.]